MDLLHHILRLCVVILFAVFGTNIAFAMPMAASNLSYSQTETVHIAQGDNASLESTPKRGAIMLPACLPRPVSSLDTIAQTFRVKCHRVCGFEFAA